MKFGRKTALYAALVLFTMILSIIPAHAASAKPALSKKKLTLYVGKSYTLKAKGFSGKVTWKSGNQKIATVSSKGKVTAKKKGTVTITAKCGKEKKTCKVTVQPVKLNKTKMTVKKGQTFWLTLKCGASKGIKWKTSKKAVVKIKSKSKNKVTLQAVKPGKATITATYKKKAYKCKVTVSKAAQQEKDPASSGTPASSDTQTPSGTPASTDKQTPSGTQTSSNRQTSSGTPTSSDTTTTSDTQGTKITEVTITTGSAKKAYDGMPLKNNEITVAGFPKGKTPVITATGTITDVGTAKNTYSIDWGDLDPKNYKISENLGTLEVVPATLTVTVPEVAVASPEYVPENVPSLIATDTVLSS